jgi:hypothetical protein
MTTIKSKLKDHIFCVCPMQPIPLLGHILQLVASHALDCGFASCLFLCTRGRLCVCENRCSYCMVRCTRMLEQRSLDCRGSLVRKHIQIPLVLKKYDEQRGSIVETTT